MTTTVDPIPPTGHLGGAPHAKLEFKRNSSRITINAAANLAEPYHARFEGPAPKLRDQGRTVTIDYP